MSRTCEVCSAPIDHLRADAIVCSAGCRARRARAQALPVPGVCQRCGATLPSGRADRKFCSGRCRSAAHRSEACIAVSGGGV